MCEFDNFCLVRYKTIVDGHSRTGTGRRKWEFFDMIDELMAGDPAVVPLSTISSMPKGYLYASIIINFIG